MRAWKWEVTVVPFFGHHVNMSHFSNSYFCHLWMASFQHTLLLFLKDSSIPQFIVNIPMNKQETTTCNTTFLKRIPTLQTPWIGNPINFFARPSSSRSHRVEGVRPPSAESYEPNMRKPGSPSCKEKVQNLRDTILFFCQNIGHSHFIFPLLFFCFPTFFVSPGSVGNVGKQVWRSLVCG